ncbi:putative mitochondrial hypothetical protein [Leptomonas pyrrhocoris]|uniref:Uncharacterized protein n=1 Tax=Leptomonas pyrrhocoris TaxID=157538 RepID=A0A0N1J508_LEPPY|nr:putative mitochondrial hypothetical protein [Leptomonas pyrrhocoris]KPA82394.1 putative mitochondrial hypothetical protein [Leptomonas pyrrhocoris]|eukprot:XP_015660833.1 putative mitochondrial hypothetical protein [Leptomonas pyrrhocoris]
MEAKETLNDYFTVVDDFFRKTFRDDCRLFMSMKSRQYSESILGVNMLGKDAALLSADVSSLTPSSPPTPRRTSPAATASGPSATAAAAEERARSEKPPTPITSFLSISPRMWLRRDGSALGKVKVAYEFDVPRVCRLQQALSMNSLGAVTAVGKVKELIEGLTAGVRVCVNTIAPASEDVTSGHIHYQRGDKYSSLRYQRNGLGSSDLLVDCGITFFNLLLGAGFERRQLSFLEQRDGPGQLDVMYAGAGFTGVNWSLAAKMIRSSDAWSNAHVAILQRLSPTTAVACQYNFDLAESVAKVSLGCMQGIQIRFPTLVQTRSGAARTSGLPAEPNAVAASWTALVPLAVAAKAESDGNCCATARGLFNKSIRWGVVARKNMLDESATWKYGLTLSMEYES